VQRGELIELNPAGEFRLVDGDVMLVLGAPEAIDQVLELADPSVPVA
jgi:Trk K+ transport system NAD-binding subunit